MEVILRGVLWQLRGMTIDVHSSVVNSPTSTPNAKRYWYVDCIGAAATLLNY